MKLRDLTEVIQTHKKEYTSIQVAMIPAKPGKCVMNINMNGEYVSGNITASEINIPKARGKLLSIIEKITTGNYTGELKTAKIKWEKATGVSRNYSYGSFKIDGRTFTISSDTHADKITANITGDLFRGYFIMSKDIGKSMAVSIALTLVALSMSSMIEEDEKDVPIETAKDTV